VYVIVCLFLFAVCNRSRYVSSLISFVYIWIVHYCFYKSHISEWLIEIIIRKMLQPL